MKYSTCTKIEQSEHWSKQKNWSLDNFYGSVNITDYQSNHSNSIPVKKSEKINYTNKSIFKMQNHEGEDWSREISLLSQLTFRSLII